MPAYHHDPCMDCGACVGVCPHDAVELFDGFVTFTDACTECDLCTRICPVDAIESVNGLVRSGVAGGKGRA